MIDPATKDEWLASMREHPRPIIFPIIAWLSFIGFGIVLLILAAGCASSPSPRTEVCYMQPLGRTEAGMSVVMQHCVSPEEFKEAQK